MSRHQTKPLPPSEQKQFDPALADIRWSSRERKKPERLALPVMQNEDADEDESWSFFSPAEEIPTSVQVFVLEEEQPDGSLTETLYDPTEPTSLREAMRTPEFQQWRIDARGVLPNRKQNMDSRRPPERTKGHPLPGCTRSKTTAKATNDSKAV